ncbi:MAG: sulfatase-like hydrolase/transferase, partial [bacterium]|nr:sulfatase-like hydrolase/transferase [bacterium]
GGPQRCPIPPIPPLPPPPPPPLRPVKTADHGEMKLTHNNQIQKMFNFYEETMRVPLIYSNPVLWPTPVSSDALVSHVDFVPTLATLLGAPPGLATAVGWQGVSYANNVIQGPAAPAVQDEIVFLFDDFQYGQAAYFGSPVPPNLIRSIVEDRWKFAEYYDPTGRQPSEFECYDLLTDPDEVDNLAWPGRAPLTPYQAAQKNRLAAKLAQVVARKLVPRLGVTWPVAIASAAMVTTDETSLSRSASGAAMGLPVGGMPATPPGVTVQVVYSPVGGFGATNASAPCVADVEWTVYSTPGIIEGTAKAKCAAQPDGTVTFDGVASVVGGTGAWRGLRGDGLLLRASVPPPLSGGGGTLSINGTAVVKSLE